MTNLINNAVGTKPQKRRRGRQRRMVRPPESNGGADTTAEPDPAPAAASAPRSNRATAVIALLSRPDGVTLSELIAATGWLPHTTRAALTGLRKRGHPVERCKRDDTTCYRIAAATQ